jgi:hypothetical protein
MNYPTVEWTVYFKKEGAADTPLIESIQARGGIKTWRRRSVYLGPSGMSTFSSSVSLNPGFV